jgi:carboxyl-terminal processing protease
MTSHSVRRSPLASAIVLVAVLLLFGAATFVAGLTAGAGVARPGPSDPGEPSPTVVVPSEAATPRATPVLETISCAQPSDAFAVLCETYARIQADYVDEVDEQALVDGAVRGMIEYGLGDPYSGYLPPSQYGRALDDLSGEFSGIGAEVGMENLDDPGDLAACTVVTSTCAMIIVAPLDGSPAEAAGLRSGDQVLAIDGTSTAGESLSTLVFEIRGEAGTDVTLTIRRGEDALDITITRAVIDLREVRSELLDGGVAYLRLTSFTDRSTALFRDALRSLIGQGADRIVLDLRGNPGGYIVAAQGIASQFLPAGELLFTVESGERRAALDRRVRWPGGRCGDPGRRRSSTWAPRPPRRSWRRRSRRPDARTIVGTRTFGKNTVQIWSDLPNGGGLRLTTDRWFTPATTRWRRTASSPTSSWRPGGSGHATRTRSSTGPSRSCAGWLSAPRRRRGSAGTARGRRCRR